MAYKYCVAENWGKGFIEHDEAKIFTISGFPGNVWQIPVNNKDANLWVYKVAGTFKTRVEAQAIVDAEISQSQTNFDIQTEAQKTQESYTSLTTEQKQKFDIKRAEERPVNITLPE